MKNQVVWVAEGGYTSLGCMDDEIAPSDGRCFFQLTWNWHLLEDVEYHLYIPIFFMESTPTFPWSSLRLRIKPVANSFADLHFLDAMLR